MNVRIYTWIVLLTLLVGVMWVITLRKFAEVEHERCKVWNWLVCPEVK